MSEENPHPRIHPTAIVEEGALLGAGVEIGPYSLVGPNVTLGARTILANNVTIGGKTRIGEDNRIGPYSVIGLGAQHLRDTGEGAEVVIGHRNTIREFVTIHAGTVVGGRITCIGDDNFLMCYVHVGHDCHIGNRVVMANACNLGGHTVVRDKANLGGMVAVHQFVAIGEYVMVGGASAVRHDVAPYCLVEGNPARLRGLNLVGLKRSGFCDDSLRVIKRAHRILFRSRLTVDQAIRAIEGNEELASHAEVKNLVAFFRSSKRGVCR